ncbi:hypothetical protein JCM18918_3783 [Cutibacterium acnes JCM 18918]|nr:hypothetical protein JCM18918_3783 [Cutibacterium acnes JCM 18918]
MVAGPGCGPGAGHRLDGSGCLGDEGRLLLAEVCRDQNGLTARAGYEVGEDLGDLPVGLGDDRSGTWSEVRAALRPVMMSIHRSHSADQLSGPGAAMASVTVGEAASAMADSADAVRKVRRDGVPNKGHAPRERVAALPHVQVCCPETLQESGYHCHQLDIIFF